LKRRFLIKEDKILLIKDLQKWIFCIANLTAMDEKVNFYADSTDTVSGKTNFVKTAQAVACTKP